MNHIMSFFTGYLLAMAVVNYIRNVWWGEDEPIIIPLALGLFCFTHS